MNIRRIAAAVTIAISLGAQALQAGAAVTPTVSAYEQMTVSYNSFDPDENVWRDGYFTVYREVGAAGEDAGVTPSVVIKAAAGYVACGDLGCDGESFPLQNVAATALSFDLLGNAPRFTECLAPSSGPCKQFDISFAKPSIVMVGGCGAIPACINAWHDPADGSAAASASVGIYRSGYSVAGTWAGQPYAPPLNGYVNAGFYRTIGASVGVAA